LELLLKIAEELERRTKKTGVKGKTVTVKIKYNDFTVQTRSKTVGEFLSTSDEVFPIVKALLQQEELKMPVRLLGISLSKLNTQEPDTEDVFRSARNGLLIGIKQKAPPRGDAS
jgi:DNA polymerase-4